MANHPRGNDPRPPREPPIIPVGPWCIAKIKRYFQKRSAYRNKETAQDRSSRRTANATIWIACLAFAAAGVAGLQYCTMQGQLTEMRTERRPWLSVDYTIKGPLTFDPTPLLWMNYKITNVGQSPAMDVWLHSVLFPLVANGDAVREMHKRCAVMRQQQTGFTLFPSQHLDRENIGVAMSQADYDGNKKAMGRFDVIVIELIVCADYRFSDAPDPHSTDLLYTVGTTDEFAKGKISIQIAGFPKDFNAAINPKVMSIEADKLELYPEPYGGSYAY